MVFVLPKKLCNPYILLVFVFVLTLYTLNINKIALNYKLCNPYNILLVFVLPKK